MTIRALNTYRVEGRVKVERIEGIVFSGMGGSGVVGDVLFSLMYDSTDIPVVITKEFKLPKWVSRNWLVIAISYSGNTIETISTALEALKRGSYVAIVTSNGKLHELAKSKSIPYVLIDRGYPPRTAFPLLLVGTIKVLQAFGVELSEDIGRAINVLKSNVDPIGDELARFINNSIPIFITNSKYYPLGLRAKNEFNENSNIIAKYEVIPEWGHNDIVGWEGKYDGLIRAIVFIDPRDRVIGHVGKLLRSYGHEVKEYVLSFSMYLENILYWFKVFGIASTKHALMRGIKPEETRSIKEFRSLVRNIVKLHEFLP